MNQQSANGQSRFGLRVTTHTEQGGRYYQEDKVSIAYQKTPDGNELEFAYFGIFDGHGGSHASQFAKEHLMNFIVDQNDFWSDNDQVVLNAIKKGFHDCHMAMWRVLDSWPRTSAGMPSTAGTTASIAFIRNGKLYTGHCGDSGIVLASDNAHHPRYPQKWAAQPLTIDHKPDSEEERARIAALGGKVVEKERVHRVAWYRSKNKALEPIRRPFLTDDVPFLAVARSLGDLWSYNYRTQKFMVSFEPDVAVMDIDVTRHKCLLFASDGLWNVMDPQTAIDYINGIEIDNAGSANWRNPSKFLVDKAMDRWKLFNAGCKADNTTVIIVAIDECEIKGSFVRETKACTTAVYDYSTNDVFNLDYCSSYQSEAVQCFYNNHQTALPPFSSTNYSYMHTAASSEPSTSGLTSLAPLPTINSQQQPLPPLDNPPNDDDDDDSSDSESDSEDDDEISVDVKYCSSSETIQSAFVRGCCPLMRYVLATHEEQKRMNYHSDFQQHQEFYHNMALRNFPPLHYTYRQIDLAFLPPNRLFTADVHHAYERYRINSVREPHKDRFFYVRPTPQEFAEFHRLLDENEEEEPLPEFNSEPRDEELWNRGGAADTPDLPFEYDEEGEDEEEDAENMVWLDGEGTTNHSSEDDNVNKTADDSLKTSPTDLVKSKSNDDSIQINEISSSNLAENANKSKSDKSGKSNGGARKRRSAIKKGTSTQRKFHETRQSDRKTRSNRVSKCENLSAREKRATAKTVKKGAKAIAADSKNVNAIKIKLEPITTNVKAPRSSRKNNKENNVETATTSSTIIEVTKVKPGKRVLRSSQTEIKEATSTSTTSSTTTRIKEVAKKVVNLVRNLRSQANSPTSSSLLSIKKGKVLKEKALSVRKRITKIK